MGWHEYQVFYKKKIAITIGIVSNDLSYAISTYVLKRKIQVGFVWSAKERAVDFQLFYMSLSIFISKTGSLCKGAVQNKCFKFGRYACHRALPTGAGCTS